MTQLNDKDNSDKPTEAEIARARQILAQEAGAKPDFQQSGGLYGMVVQLIASIPRTIIIGIAVVFVGYHAWDYYNASRRDPAETQEALAKAATAQAEADAQNKKVGNDTVRGAAVEAEMEKIRAEAAAAKAQADALTQQINGLTQAEGYKRAELEKLANEARTAKAEADAQTALLYQQRQAELANTQAEARLNQYGADMVDRYNRRMEEVRNNPLVKAGQDMFDKFDGGGHSKPRVECKRRPTKVPRRRKSGAR